MRIGTIVARLVIACAIYPCIAFAEQTYYPDIQIHFPGGAWAPFFDKGGEGVAYHDSTSINEPGGFRPNEGVDIFLTDTANIGGPTYAIGWVTPGEWLEYTVNVTSSRYYDIYLFYAADGPGGTMHIEFDGVDKTGPIALSDTGGWEIWKAELVKTRVWLNAGQSVMRLAFDTGSPDGWLANIYYINVWSEGMGQSPWKNTPHLIPGKIETENYDVHPFWLESGEGATYHDSTGDNEPGDYRSDGVDVEITNDEGGGYDVGWITPAEWLEYKIDQASSGSYRIEIRYASDGDGGTMHIEFEGYDRTGPISLPDTGGWQNWQTVSVNNVYLPAGRNLVMRLVFDTPGPQGWLANVNYAWLKLNYPVSYDGSLHTIPGYIQAEAFDRGGEGIGYHDSTPQNEPAEIEGAPYYALRPHEAVDVEVTSDPDTEAASWFDVGWVTPGEWLAYVINVVQAGTYTARIRYAADGPGGTMHIEVDGVDKTGPIVLPDTGGWQEWQTITVPNISLAAGSYQRMRMVFDTGSPDGWLANINWIGLH